MKRSRTQSMDSGTSSIRSLSQSEAQTSKLYALDHMCVHTRFIAILNPHTMILSCCTHIDSQIETSDDSAISPSSRSTKPKLQDIFKELLPLAAQWQNIGILISLKPDKLDSIKKENSSSQQDCLREMLQLWDKQVDPPPTWRTMADVLQELGEDRLARKLRER